MNRTPNWQKLKLNKQCGVCIHYNQRIVNGKQTARGNCVLTGTYKMRTEKCMKFKEEK